MADLIDRRKLLEEITSEQNLRADSLMSEWYADMVKRQPKVDAVEVVRCKNCKYGIVEPVYDLIGLAQGDLVHCKNTHCICELNWFCADGERNGSAFGG